MLQSAPVNSLSLPILFRRGYETMLRFWQPVALFLAFELSWALAQRVFNLESTGMPLTADLLAAPETQGMGAKLLGYAMFLGSWWLSIGVNRVAIDAARGLPMSWRRFFVPPFLLLQVAVVLAIMWTGIGFGLLLIVPGMILFLNWCMGVNVVLDGKKNWREALPFSRELTLRHRTLLSNVFLGYFVVALPGILLSLAGSLQSMPDLTALLDGVSPQGGPAGNGANLIAMGSFLGSIGSAYFSFVGASLYIGLLADHATQSRLSEKSAS